MAKEGIKSLAKDTLVYGLSTISVRLLNWLLTFVYVRALPSTADFGIMTNLYAWVAIVMILLTYGMETGFFRFINKSEQPRVVYSTALWSLGTTSTLFVVLGLLFIGPLSAALGYPSHREYVGMLVVIVALDAFMTMPLAYLRYAKKPWRFMQVRLSFILLSIVFTLLALFGLPWLYERSPESVSWLYRPGRELYFIFAINLLCNVIQLAMLSPYFRRAGRAFDPQLLRQMLKYSWPLLLLGIAGSFNNQADKILFPLMFDDPAEGRAQLGIYGACYKLAVIMVMFTQAFRYAYDPFVFSKTNAPEEESKAAYADAMKYYIISGCFIFLGVMAYMDLLKLFLSPAYYAGLKVVPLVMIGQLMFGIYSNLSLWYKVSDKTLWGAIFAFSACTITVLIIVLGTRHYGFMACAYASLISNGLVMLASYLIGSHYYPVPYHLRNALVYALVSALLFALIYAMEQYLQVGLGLRLLLNSVVLIIFAVLSYKLDFAAFIKPIIQQRFRKT